MPQAPTADPTAILNSKNTPYSEIKEYLDGLRARGATNMFGAAPYLQRAFNLPPVEARAELSRWMELFGKGE